MPHAEKKKKKKVNKWNVCLSVSASHRCLTVWKAEECEDEDALNASLCSTGIPEDRLRS